MITQPTRARDLEGAVVSSWGQRQQQEAEPARTTEGLMVVCSDTGLPERAWPARCVEATTYWKCLGSGVERTLHRRRFTEDGNIEIRGRDLREYRWTTGERLKSTLLGHSASHSERLFVPQTRPCRLHLKALSANGHKATNGTERPR
jgi:hypothetical protein